MTRVIINSCDQHYDSLKVKGRGHQAAEEEHAANEASFREALRKNHCGHRLDSLRFICMFPGFCYIFCLVTFLMSNL